MKRFFFITLVSVSLLSSCGGETANNETPEATGDTTNVVSTPDTTSNAVVDSTSVK
jgi:hypothetical protein